MNNAEIIFVLVFIVFLVGLYYVLPKETGKPSELSARVRMNQTHPEPEPANKIIPSYISDMISQKRFDKISPDQISQLNDDYLKLVKQLNEEVIF